ncbi:hypothetical protein PJ267_00065 [Arthrobacter sp. OVS8]|nr:hypothetical protein PJ267_00065 [Arthrobacter sp. OVS8]
MGEDRDVGIFAGFQQPRHTPGVRAGAEENGRRPAGSGLFGPGVGEVQGNSSDGSAGAAERGLCPHVLGRAGRGLEQPAQPPAGGAGGLGVGEGAADLARDFTFTHHHRIQAGGNGEEMFDGGGSRSSSKRAARRILGSPEQRTTASRTYARGVEARQGRELAIDFEPVAGGQDHGRGDARLVRDKIGVNVGDRIGDSIGDKMRRESRGRAVQGGGGFRV